MDIKNKIIKSEPAEWKKFKFLQTDKFKQFPEEDKQKLRKSIIENNFIEAFKIWEDKKTIYCLDGFHRILIFEELEAEGIKIPEKLQSDWFQKYYQ
jgi:hypothetical protein